MPDSDYFALQAADASTLASDPDAVEDGQGAHPEDIPAGLINLSVALDKGTAAATADAAAELRGMAE